MKEFFFYERGEVFTRVCGRGELDLRMGGGSGYSGSAR